MSSTDPYRVPLMSELHKVKQNGFKVVSTFSGGGGSSLGYLMAGCRVVMASEFVESARDTYAANFPKTPIDGRDIRELKADDVFKVTGLKRGELDIFDGSPPCSAFSMVGKRGKGWGGVKKYSDTEQRVDDLFFEYARLLEGLQPRAFVAENVPGLAQGAAKGYFREIFKRLQDCGYTVHARVLDAQWLGVPQARKRLIFVGTRSDLNLDAPHPTPVQQRYTLEDAWQGLDGSSEVESGFEGYALEKEWRVIKQGTVSDKYINLYRAHLQKPSPTVTATAAFRGAAGVAHPTEPRKYSIAELKRVCSFPDDYRLEGTYQQKFERLGRAVPPLMMKAIATRLVKELNR